MAARLTKPIRWRKIFVALQACSLAGLAASAPLPLSHTNQLRDCVARAQGAAAVAACEKQQQTALKARIEQLSETIRARLDARQRLAFDRNMSAWQAFFDSERARDLLHATVVSAPPQEGWWVTAFEGLMESPALLRYLEDDTS